MTTGFIDLASMHSALVAVGLGKNHTWTSWNSQSLVEVTHLLMRDNIRVLPSMSGEGNADELYQIVLKYFRQLEFQSSKRRSANQQTLQWMEEAGEDIQAAWDQCRKYKQFDSWLDLQRSFFWRAHVKRHKSLFDAEFIPYLARNLGCAEKYLKEVHSLSSDVRVVTEWHKNNLNSPESQLANLAWVLSGLIRGKYYQFLGSRKQLLLHPFRRYLKYEVKGEDTLPITNSEAYFTKIIIGSALLEKNEESRVNAWTTNIDLAKRSIPGGSKGAILPHYTREEDAEWFACELAKKVGLPSSSKRLERALNLATSLGIKAASFLAVDFWMPGTSLAMEKAYELHKGNSISSDVVNKMLSTKWRYKRLADLAAGKIRYIHAIKNLKK